MTTKNYANWSDLTIERMTNWFLYGTEDTPSNYADRLRTTTQYNDVVKLNIDVTSFMSTGPGRWAHPADIPFVKNFFSENLKIQ